MYSKKMLHDILHKYSSYTDTVSGGIFSTDKDKNIKIEWENYYPFWMEFCNEYSKNEKIFANNFLYEYNPNDESTLRFTFISLNQIINLIKCKKNCY